MNQTKILAPVKGKVIPLEQVPDEVFAEKVLGDGVAIIPEDGKIYSPVDGTITTITDSLHAYGFETEDGIQMIVHFGLETVNLKGKGFTSNVKVGDKVKAGDLVAEVDLAYLREQHVETITPVIVCGGIEYDDLMFQYGETEAKEVLMRTKEPQKKMEIPEASAIETSVQENADVKKETKKKDAAKTPKEKKKVVILRAIAQEFEQGKTYTERQVNEILKEIFPDYVTLRRYLIEYGYLRRTRDGSAYWKN